MNWTKPKIKISNPRIFEFSREKFSREFHKNSISKFKVWSKKILIFGNFWVILEPKLFFKETNEKIRKGWPQLFPEKP